MNTRTIRELLRGHIDPRLGKVLIAQQEDIAALKQQVMTLAGLFDRVLDNQITQASAVERLRSLTPLYQQMKETAVAVGSDPSLIGGDDV